MKELNLTYPTGATVMVDDDTYATASKYSWDQMTDHGIPRFFSYTSSGQKIWLHKLAAKIPIDDDTVEFIRCKNHDYYDMRRNNLIIGRRRKEVRLPMGVVPRGSGYAGLVYANRERFWTDIVETPQEAFILYRQLKNRIDSEKIIASHAQMSKIMMMKLEDRLRQLRQEEESIRSQLNMLAQQRTTNSPT